MILRDRNYFLNNILFPGKLLRYETVHTSQSVNDRQAFPLRKCELEEQIVKVSLH
jgi:hypothetical protein